MNILDLIGRNEKLFFEDIFKHEKELSEIVKSSNFLVIGGAGSIGQAVTKEIFKRNPKKLHVVDISENNIVELVRDIRSSFGYIKGDFQVFALDVNSVEFDTYFEANTPFDYVLNLSALKHVRSEKDQYTLMRMFKVNILNTDKTIKQSIEKGVKKYFCVSTDKAANPANLMGASKRIMEMLLIQNSEKIKISTARFANVAFSDGSLLHGFNQRIQKLQPIVAPNDVKRYFLTPQESGELCLMATIFGDNRDIFFPKLNENLHQVSFSDIAVKYIISQGYEPQICSSEEEARDLIKILPSQGKWPCIFSKSDTTGEKDYEEFYTENEIIDLNKYKNLGIVKNSLNYDPLKISFFQNSISEMQKSGVWTKDHLVNLCFYMIPDFKYIEKGKYLDSKM